MNKLLFALIIFTGVRSLDCMDNGSYYHMYPSQPKSPWKHMRTGHVVMPFHSKTKTNDSEVKLSSILLSQTYHHFSKVLNQDIARYIFLFHLELANFPIWIEQCCESSEGLVQCINSLLKSYGYDLARELFKQFFSSERSICDIKSKSKWRHTSGQTALHNAAGSGNAKVVKFLLDIAGDNVWKFLIMKNLHDINLPGGGLTALHCAAFNGHVEVVKLLLNAAGKRVYLLLEAKDHNDMTALHWAVARYKNKPYSNTEVAKLLLDAAGDKAQDYITMRGGPGLPSAFNLADSETKEVMKPYFENQCCSVFYLDCVLF